MDWNRTKSIFILVFFILNVFLLYQLLDKINENRFQLITETSIEELLKEEDIKYVPLPKQKVQEQFLMAKSKTFKEKELPKMDNQELKVMDGTTLSGTFKKPLTISQNIQSSELETLVKEQMMAGDEYKFYKYDETLKTITFYQVYDKKMFYNNSKGKITLFLNSKGEIDSYEQTYLENIEKYNKQKELVLPIKAIEVLYREGDLMPKSNITKVELGFYNSLQTPSQSHLFVPAWRVAVEGKDDLFVNAFDGEVIELNTEEKILE
ncbi:two-component system regulatory protein YycI [Bacillus massiliglaciei]|uniref:two-component system regulatory protein YycI n=1 Tax=Bacillus massiliglaciei TaxID=1816693 RepID=UPI000DA5F11B|nr:two-component system regulatory protein YycI [Bacillus massiliglaciei]